MLDLTKPVQTRDGRKARIICTDRVSTVADKAAIVALVMLPTGNEPAFYFGDDGCLYGGRLDGPSSLINVPERKERFFNVYIGDTHTTLDAAKSHKTRSALATGKMTFEDGIPVSVEVVERY